MTNPRPKMILLALAASTLLSTAAQAQLTTVAVGPRPESITRGWHGKMYVSIQGPSGALGTFDGEIRQVDLSTGVVTPFVSGLENPRGLTFTGKFLVTADQQKIFKIDEAGNKTLLAAAADFPFPAVFFNDCEAEDGGKAVFVSEMGRRDIIRIGATPPAPNVLIPTDSDAAYAVPATSRIYRISMEGKITSMFEPSRKLLVINGIVDPRGHHNRLLATDFFHGNIVSVNLRKGTKHIIATAFRGADGLAQGRDGTIYVSSFENGQVWRMDKHGENQRQLLSGIGFQTTADFFLDEAAHQIYVPDTAHGNVIIISNE